VEESFGRAGTALATGVIEILDAWGADSPAAALGRDRRRLATLAAMLLPLRALGVAGTKGAKQT
jgi:hypothetical protein